MESLKITEQKKRMAEVRVRQGKQSTSKTNLSGIQTRAFKKRKLEAGKEAPGASEAQDVSYPPTRSSKKMKTLMGDLVSNAELAVITLLQDSGASNDSYKANPSTKFKFWSNSFDGLRFLYDHLNVIEDVEKGKTIGTQQVTQNIGAYLMRYAVMSMRLFEVGNAYEQNVIRLTKEVTQLKDFLKVQTD